MNKNYTLRDYDEEGLLYRRIYLLIRKNGLKGQAIGAALGLCGAMLSIILGGLLWAALHFLALGALASLLTALEIIFFVLPLPLLALGACCLDLLEKRVSLLPAQSATQLAPLDRSQRLRFRHPHNN
jgi:hypothetical protein